MNHDPLCPAPLCDWTGEVGNDCMGYEDCWHDCQCTLIARVREDERQQAHKIIDRFDMFSDDREAMHAWIDGTPPDWWTETSNG